VPAGGEIGAGVIGSGFAGFVGVETGLLESELPCDESCAESCDESCAGPDPLPVIPDKSLPQPLKLRAAINSKMGVNLMS
jgi:hypothetical protein